MSKRIEPLELARRLVQTPSLSPQGDSNAVAELLADILAPAGFEIYRTPTPPFGVNLLARLPGGKEKRPLCLTGHLDTVPLGESVWSVDPFAAEVKDGKLFGRGASDMKSGVASLCCAALALAELGRRKSDLWLIFTAAEELGCLGAKDAAASRLLPNAAGALLVAEPTACRPLLGHKGALWLRADFSGKSAHGSMPEAGDSAIFKAASAVLALQGFCEAAAPHPELGKSTLNVGTFRGGGKINMVPDAAYLELDIRSLPGQTHDAIEASLRERLGSGVKLTRLVDMPPVMSAPDEPWLRSSLELASRVLGRELSFGTVSYFTDASVLWPVLGSPPTLIFGPGAPSQAHQTDEYCPVREIEEAASFYTALGRAWLEG